MSTPMDSQPKKSLEELIAWSKEYVKSLTPEQKAKMIREQAESWARSEAQWAEDFREGRTERD